MIKINKTNNKFQNKKLELIFYFKNKYEIKIEKKYFILLLNFYFSKFLKKCGLKEKMLNYMKHHF